MNRYGQYHLPVGLFASYLTFQSNIFQSHPQAISFGQKQPQRQKKIKKENIEHCKKNLTFFNVSIEEKIDIGLVANIPTVIFFFRIGITSLYTVIFGRFRDVKSAIFGTCLKSDNFLNIPSSSFFILITFHFLSFS